MLDHTTKQLIQQIYESKCVELRIDNQEVLRGRFVQTIADGIPGRLLDLSGQQLRAGTMPFVVALIRNLAGRCDRLRLDDNPIGDDGCVFLLEAGEALTQYLELSLRSVGLSPAGTITFLKRFEGSKLQTLKMGSNPSAERRNRFSEESCQFVGQFLSKCSSLHELEFANTQLRALNGLTMFRSICGQSNLRRLNLANTGVSNQAVQQLCAKATFLPYLEELDLTGNETLTDESCLQLQGLVKLQRRLRCLVLRNCSGLSVGAAQFFQSLQYKSADRLAEMEEKQRRDAVRGSERTERLLGLGQGVVNLLTFDKVIVKGEQQKAKAADKHEKHAEEFTTSLRVLDVSGIPLTAIAVKHLARALDTNESLEKLLMEDCGIDFNREDFTEALQLLFTSLNKIRTLKHLSLSKNNLMDRCCDFIKLLVSRSLEVLDLSFTRIGDKTLVAISNTLGDETAVRSLYCQGNNCDNEGAAALFSAVQKYPRLQQLDVNLNRIKFQLSEKLNQLIVQNIEQNSQEALRKLEQRHKELTVEVRTLEDTQQELAKVNNKQAELLKELAEKASNLLKQNSDYESHLESLRTENDKLNRVQTGVEGELSKLQAANGDIQGKIDQETAQFEQKRKQIREKQAAIQARSLEVEEELKKLQADAELQKLERDLEKRKKEKESAEKDAVAALAQLAAIEACLIKEGVVQIAGGAKSTTVLPPVQAKPKPK